MRSFCTHWLHITLWEPHNYCLILLNLSRIYINLHGVWQLIFWRAYLWAGIWKTILYCWYSFVAPAAFYFSDSKPEDHSATSREKHARFCQGFRRTWNIMEKSFVTGTGLDDYFSWAVKRISIRNVAHCVIKQWRPDLSDGKLKHK